MEPVGLLLPLESHLCPELVNSHKKGVDYDVKYEWVLCHLLGELDRLGYPQNDVEQLHVSCPLKVDEVFLDRRI